MLIGLNLNDRGLQSSILRSGPDFEGHFRFETEFRPLRCNFGGALSLTPEDSLLERQTFPTTVLLDSRLQLELTFLAGLKLAATWRVRASLNNVEVWNKELG